MLGKKQPILFFSMLAVVIFGISTCSDEEKIEEIKVHFVHTRPSGFIIAFIGDHDVNSNSKAVLRLIKDEGADMVLHQGDLGYNARPAIWMEQVDDILGSPFPYFASVGNHEAAVWSEYQDLLQARLNKISGVNCTGDFGVNTTCTYKGIFFILSGIGTLGNTIGTTHEEYIRDQLAQSNALWKICSWHKNQRFMQVSNAFDEVGWEAYEACRLEGAIIATGHAHSYSRTHLIGNFRSQFISSTSNHLNLSKGKTFAFVSGLGGKEIGPGSDGLANKPWWASVYTANEDANYGALFCAFRLNGEPDQATCYFKTIDGLIVDSFDITSQL